jgi:hypothetical protein
MSHFGLTANPNENPVSAGKVREACTGALRELGDRLKNKIDQILITGDFAKDRRYSFLKDDGKIKLTFDLSELANGDRTEAERDTGEGYYHVPDLVKEYLEGYYNALGWGTDYSRHVGNQFHLTVGPIKKDLV